MSDSSSNPSLINVSNPSSGVVLITLDRENKRNALNNPMLLEIADAVSNAERTGDVRCMVVTGSETVFSAGADIQEMRTDGLAAITNQDRVTAWKTIEDTSIPLIAAVSGLCFGGGHELAMLCDIVIASETAQFGQPEIKLGHIPGDGATQRLTRLTGKYVAMKMILTGEPISANEAFRVGLAAEVVGPDACLGRALELADLIARHSSKALGFAKDAVLAAEENFLSEGLAVERRNIAQAFTTHDQREGLAAFFEKRPPQFTNS